MSEVWRTDEVVNSSDGGDGLIGGGAVIRALSDEDCDPSFSGLGGVSSSELSTDAILGEGLEGG